MRRSSAPILSILALSSGACSPDAENQSEAATAPVVRDSAGVRIVENYAPTSGEPWELGREPLFRIRASDGTDANRLLDPASLDVDSEGRIIVADGNQVGWHAILVYSSEGEFLFQAGRPGEGPGEFGQLWWASSYRGDSIIGFDMARDRASIFDGSGNFARAVNMPTFPYERPARGTFGFTAGMDAAYSDGHLLAYPRGAFDPPAGSGTGWTTHELLRLAPDGESWDSLGIFRIMEGFWDGTRQQQIHLSPYPFHAVWRQSLYYGLGTTYEIRRYGPRGELDLIVRRNTPRRAVSQDQKAQFVSWIMDRVRSSREVNEEMLEQIQRNYEDGLFADSLPAFSAGFVDQLGNLWVEDFRWISGVERSPVTTPTTWSVFDSTGVWTAALRTPPGFIAQEATADRVYGFVVDEFDVKETRYTSYPVISVAF